MHIHTGTKKNQGPCVKKKGSLWRDLGIGILVQYNYNQTVIIYIYVIDQLLITLPYLLLSVKSEFDLFRLLTKVPL